MYLKSGEFKTFFGSDNEPGLALTMKDVGTDPLDRTAVHKGVDPHFVNFVDCVRSRRWQDLNADIAEGHLSTAMCHLGNIAYRTDKKLTFNPESERFINDDDANSYLKRRYRHPYSMPDVV